MNNDILVSLKDISFRYNSELVLDTINLDLKRGEFLGIIGPNGSGKTTLLKIILGLLAPQRGSVQLFGQDVASFKDWPKIGYVPQKAGSTVTQFPITVEEVIEIAGNKQSVARALAAVGMEKEKKRLLNELSGGQEQRVFIARALSTNPELLILDEPTVGVDVDSQAKFYQLLRDLNTKHHLTLVLVSHDVDVVAHEVSTVACINKKLFCYGKPKEVFKSSAMEQLYGKELRFVIHGH